MIQLTPLTQSNYKSSPREVREGLLVHPLNWWAGMKNPLLQVMLHGKGIAAYEVELRHETNLHVTEVARFANSNYIIIYIDNSKYRLFELTH